MTIEDYVDHVVMFIAETSDSEYCVNKAIELADKVRELAKLYDGWQTTKPKLARLCHIDIMKYMDELRDIEDMMIK